VNSGRIEASSNVVLQRISAAPFPWSFNAPNESATTDFSRRARVVPVDTSGHSRSL
jgi:hypothetical protein